MNTSSLATSNDQATRAAVTRGLVIAVLVLAAAGGGLAWWLSRPAPTLTTPTDLTATPAAAPQPVVDPYAQVKAQIAADRIASPAGDNAIETYLSLLAAQPDDTAARQALTELLPFAARLGERAANAGDAAELDRLIALIAAADAGYAQLRTLRERRTALAEAEARAEAQALRAADTAATPVTPARPATATDTPPADPDPGRTAANQPVPTPAPPPTTTRTPVTTTPAAPPPAPVAAAPPPAAPTPAPARSAVVIEAEQINTVAPAYPPAARARRLEGWVEVELVVDVRGMPREVNVVNAQPAGVFNREAERAASRWRFKPRSIDGTPVDSRIRRRINFRLPD